MREAADEENHARSTAQGRIEVDVKMIGDRPFGQIAMNSPIVQTASAVIQAFGMTPTYGMQQHRFEHSDEHGNSCDHPRIRRNRRS